MKLVFAGTPAVAVPVAAALHEACGLAAVITRPPAAQGRSARLVPSPVEAWARAQGIEVLAPERVGDCRERLAAIAPDCCPVVAYGELVPPALLDLPRYGWVNLHFSLLPAYRGAAPVQRALLDGATVTGVTVFRLVRALDAGPVYRRRTVAIGDDETAGDLLDRLAGIGAEVMLDALRGIAAGETPLPQPADGLSLAPKVTVADARLDLAQPVRQVVNRVRAMSPEPGAWATLGGTRFKVLRAVPVARDDDAVVGTLVATKRTLLVRAGDGWLELAEVQAEGRKPMAGADWARGAFEAGLRLE